MQQTIRMETDRMQNPNVVTLKLCPRCGRELAAFDREYACPRSKQIPAKKAAVAPSVPRLSPREQQIVCLVQRGKSNKEIAYSLCITVGTVKEYVYHIFRKLGVTNRTELALLRREYDNEAEAVS